MGTFLVTGANSGLGRATVEALAARGEVVVMAARSEERTIPVLEDLRRRYPEATLDFLHIDLASLRSVRDAASTFLASGRPLDVLVNNGGIAGAHGLSPDGFEITIATNHIGPFELTRLLLPRLKEANQGRVVNVASAAHMRVKELDWSWLDRRERPTRSGFGAYAVSKLMNILHARELARRLAAQRDVVSTYAVHPGAVATNIWRSLPWPIRPLLMLSLMSSERGAKTQVWCATAPELASSSGRYYYQCREAHGSSLSGDAGLAAELYERTERLLS